jgi:hypothetical protein
MLRQLENAPTLFQVSEVGISSFKLLTILVFLTENRKPKTVLLDNHG